MKKDLDEIRVDVARALADLFRSPQVRAAIAKHDAGECEPLECIVAGCKNNPFEVETKA